MYHYFVNNIKYGPVDWEGLCLLRHNKVIDGFTQILLPDGSQCSFQVLRERLKNTPSADIPRTDTPKTDVPRTDIPKNESAHANNTKEVVYTPLEEAMTGIGFLFCVIFSIISLVCFGSACSCDTGFADSLTQTILVVMGTGTLFLAVLIPFLTNILVSLSRALRKYLEE